MAIVISSRALHTEQDVLRVRGEARLLAGLLGFDEAARITIATAVGIVARSSFSCAPGANLEFLVKNLDPALTIRVSPFLGGEADLDTVRRLMDRCDSGAAIQMEKALPEGAPVDSEPLAAISAALAAVKPETLLEALLRHDLELLGWIERSDNQQMELLQVNQELVDTNLGVMALYTELDERTLQLRKVSELKSRFLSNLSHEVRTPVNSILALTNLLLNRVDGPLTAEQEKQVNYIRESASQLSRLVADELDLAKVEAGKISVNLSSFEIRDVFAALRGMFKPLAHNPEVNLLFEEPYGIPQLYTDEGKVAQILRNLVSNAMKFTSQGEIRVSARFDPKLQTVEFVVADTGIGIAPEDQERIFEEFFQAATEAQARGEGAGIGLHLSRRLAQLLGGSLQVSSKLEAGAAFTAAIPLIYPHGEGVPGAAGSTADSAKAPILVIDDDPVSRYLVRQTVGESEWRILEAESGAKGLAMARADKPRVVFLDLIMPELSGFEVLRQFKFDPVLREIPIVILTSKTLEDAERRRLEPDVEAIVYKANVTRDLLRGIIYGLDKSSSRKHTTQ